MNKKLILTIVVLIPITIISFYFKETNFIMSKNKQNQEQYLVPVNINDNIVQIPLEEYVIGVVAGEMPALFELEALKAQAIASRTYVINHLKTNASISTSISDQVYLTEEEMYNKWQDKYQEYYEKIKSAVESTHNQIIYYNGEPIKAYYYSMSNGYTESSINVFNEETDYLNIVASPFDKDNEETITLSTKEFCSKLNIECQDLNISSIEKDDSQRISKIKINDKTFTGLEIRKKLDLRSTDFSFYFKDNTIEITTKGYGHGVGMSQYGANNMAKVGFNCEEILKYYYQNVEINSI